MLKQWFIFLWKRDTFFRDSLINRKLKSAAFINLLYYSFVFTHIWCSHASKNAIVSNTNNIVSFCKSDPSRVCSFRSLTNSFHTFLWRAMHFKEKSVSLSESSEEKPLLCRDWNYNKRDVGDNCRFNDRFTGRHDKFQTFLKLLDPTVVWVRHENLRACVSAQHNTVQKIHKHTHACNDLTQMSSAQVKNK